MTPVLGLFGVALAELILAAVVWRRGPGRRAHRWFAVFVATLAAWCVLVGLRRSLRDPAAVLVVVRILYAHAALIPVTFAHFATQFPTPTAVRPLGLTLLRPAGVGMAALALSPWMIPEVRREAGGYLQPVYGPLYPVFAAYFTAAAAWALGRLAAHLRHATGFPRAQLHYLFTGAGLTALCGITLGLAVPLLTGTSRHGVYGPYFTLILVGFIAHSVIRHRLMDIRVVVSRTAAYALGWILTAGLLVAGAVLLDAVTPFSPTLTPAGAVGLGLAASLGFLALGPPLRRLADRYLYRPAYDARQIVRDGSRATAAVATPEEVAAALGSLIDRALRPESLAILWRREGAAFEAAFRRHVDPAFAWPSRPLTAASPLGRALAASPGALTAEDLARGAPRPDVLVDLRAWGAEVAVPVRGEQDLLATILVGPKLSGDPFFQDDLDVLETLGAQLAIGLQNARLYQQVVAIMEYNERILAHMDSGVVAVRPDGVVTTFNPAAERITGLPAASVLGQPLQRLPDAVQVSLADGLAGRREAEREVWLTQADGRSLPLLVHVSVLHDPAGGVRGAIAVFTDHSRLKAVEEDKRRAERLLAVAALATGIAHEIRNPLVAIKTLAELLPERADDPEFRSRFAKVAVKEIHRIETLLGRLRALAVPAAARLEPVELRGPLDETLDLLQGEAERRGIRVALEIEPELPAILGEPGQLKQLFLNLCLNGLEAMGSGGSLQVTARAERDRQGGALVTVRVTDTGPGIPREDLPRVFEPFFTTKAQGTGLGLAICRGIADAHRAALWAEAGPGGVGTSFVVQFPAVARPALAETVR